MESSVFWSMMEAIGTIFAAFVDLLFGLREDIRKWYSRPILKLEYNGLLKLDENGSYRARTCVIYKFIYMKSSYPINDWQS